HCLADRQLAQRHRRFGDDDRRSAVDRWLHFAFRRGDDVTRRIDCAAAIEPLGPVILQALMVAPQPLFDAERRLIGTRIGVGGHAFRMQRDFRIQMNGAFGAKAKTFALQRGMSRIAAVEILAHRFGDPRLDTPAQCLADLNVFSGDAKRHACLRAVASLPRSDGTLSAYSTYVSYRAESTLAASLKRRATVRRWRISGQRRDLLVAPALHRRRNA